MYDTISLEVTSLGCLSKTNEIFICHISDRSVITANIY